MTRHLAGIVQEGMRQIGPRERLLLVGTSVAAVKLAREIYERRQELGVEIVGFVDADPRKVGEAVEAGSLRFTSFTFYLFPSQGETFQRTEQGLRFKRG